jgi:cell fate (sporulation/competence/biofilm development) regulator YlbF (YheA/YmcA/DUF963 family)
MTSTIPADMQVAIDDAKARARRIRALQRELREADGPDEHEAAQARLNAYLDEISDADDADLARLGYARNAS